MGILGTFKMSRHAELRCAQRGVINDRLVAILEHADVETQIGQSRVAYSVSKKKSRSLNLGDTINRYAVLASNDGCVITVTPIHSDQRGRKYRKGYTG